MSKKDEGKDEGQEGQEVLAVATATAAVAAPPAGWNERVGAFASSVGKSVDEVSNALAEVVGVPGEQALAILADEDAAPFGDIADALKGLSIPKGVLRKNVALLRGPKAAPIVVDAGRPGQSYDVLPSVPDDISFLEMLKTGGVLKVGMVEVLAAIKASLADRVDLYGLPDVILRRMEEFADAQGDPCGDNFYRLQKMVTSRSYAEVLSVIGISGNFVSERRKKALLAKLDSLWPALSSFHKQLVAWQESWSQGAANPGMLLAALAFGNNAAGIMPPGMLQPPETDHLRDAAEAVIDKINQVFAGPGIPVARALAYDAAQIKAVIDEPSLPGAIGAANKEQMVKSLGVAVGSDLVRMEHNVTRYALSVMKLKDVTAGQAEYAYLAALLQLGSSIPWDKLVDTGRRAR